MGELGTKFLMNKSYGREQWERGSGRRSEREGGERDYKTDWR